MVFCKTVGLSPITLGNLNAPVLITMVSNPFCGPCAKAHEVIDNLLERYSDYFKVEFIFIGGNHAINIIKHIYSLEKSQIHDALKDWYKTTNYEHLVSKYPSEISESAENQ